ncbi:MAG: YcxB family protein [Massilia sp.]
MLWFNHPKTAGAPKALAPFGRPARLPRRASAGSAPNSELPVLATDPRPATPADLAFLVRYSLFEYLRFMWQHAGYLIRRRRVGRLATWYMLAKSTSISGFHFITQGRSSRTYEFTVDPHGIVRSTAGGVTLIGWEDVLAIRSYSCGFMLVLKRGTLPIPFRCLSAEQRLALAGYAPWLKAGAIR